MYLGFLHILLFSIYHKKSAILFLIFLYSEIQVISLRLTE